MDNKSQGQIMDNPTTHPSASDTIDLAKLIKNVFQRKKLIMLVASMLFVIAISIYLTRPIFYQGSVLVKLFNEKSSPENPLTITSENDITHASLNTKIALLKSEFTLLPVIHKLNLDFSTHTKNENLKLKQTLLKLQNQLSIIGLTDNEPNANIAIFKVTLKNPSPNNITALLNEIVLTFQQKTTDSRLKSLDMHLAALNQQLPKALGRWEEVEIKLLHSLNGYNEQSLKNYSNYLATEINTTQKQLVEMQLKKAKLLVDYTLKHPLMRTYDKSYEALKTKHASLRIKLNESLNLQQKIIPLIKQRELEKSLYFNILQQIQALEISKNNAYQDIEIISHDDFPIEINHASPIVIIIALVILSVMIATLSLLSIEILKNFGKSFDTSCD